MPARSSKLLKCGPTACDVMTKIVSGISWTAAAELFLLCGLRHVSSLGSRYLGCC